MAKLMILQDKSKQAGFIVVGGFKPIMLLSCR